MEVSRAKVSRRVATELFARTADPELGHLLGFFFDRVARADLGDEEFTYDLSVPDNVTYVANGFVSHNTIGLLMDCDTTGVEPDLGLVKTKKLVGGGTMSIVNQTVPRALSKLGYRPARSTRSSPTSTSTRRSSARRTWRPSTWPCSPARWVTTPSTIRDTSG